MEECKPQADWKPEVSSDYGSLIASARWDKVNFVLGGTDFDNVSVQRAELYDDKSFGFTNQRGIVCFLNHTLFGAY